MAVGVAARVALERPAGGFEGFEGGQTELQPEKQMAGACSCESCHGKACGRPAGGLEGFEGFEGGQTAVLNALKNRWLGRVAARVALERPRKGLKEGFEAFDGGQTELQRPEKQRRFVEPPSRKNPKACERYAGKQLHRPAIREHLHVPMAVYVHVSMPLQPSGAVFNNSSMAFCSEPHSVSER